MLNLFFLIKANIGVGDFLFEYYNVFDHYIIIVKIILIIICLFVFGDKIIIFLHIDGLKSHFSLLKRIFKYQGKQRGKYIIFI